MNLEDFVSESISQIVKGVMKAQRELAGTQALVNPWMQVTSREHSIGQAEGLGGQPVSQVEFDVAVTATEAAGTKGGIGVVVGVFALGSQGKSDSAQGTESRIRFKVPLLLPAQNKPSPK